VKNEETGGARDPLQDIEKGKKERGFRVIWELLLLLNLSSSLHGAIVCGDFVTSGSFFKRCSEAILLETCGEQETGVAAAVGRGVQRRWC
jgi:hypothetical protein